MADASLQRMAGAETRRLRGRGNTRSSRGHGRAQNTTSAPKPLLEDVQRKNWATSVTAFEDIGKLKALIRPRYESHEEYREWHYLDLIIVVHHTCKDHLHAVLEDPDHILMPFLKRKRGTFNYYKNLDRICSKLSEQAAARTAHEGGLHCAQFYRNRWKSLEGRSGMHDEAISKGLTTLEAATALEGVAATKVAVILEVEKLKMFLGPRLRSGMMSSKYRKAERPGDSTTALSISEAKSRQSGSRDSILEIITNSNGGKVVKDALESVNALDSVHALDSAHALHSVDELRDALGHSLFWWMEATDCWRKKGVPALAVVPRDPDDEAGDQVVIVRVGPDARTVLAKYGP